MGGGSAGNPGEKKTNKSVNKCHPAPVRSTFLWNHDKKKQLKLLIESHSSIKNHPLGRKKKKTYVITKSNHQRSPVSWLTISGHPLKKLYLNSLKMRSETCKNSEKNLRCIS